MRVRKGICLILCILLLTALAPRSAFAVSGESVDGVWASIALTGGANKVIFSADSEVEQQILNPGEQTPAQYILPEGVSYDAASNTLSLTDYDGATANLVLTMMGGDFRIFLSGSSSLASVRSESMGRGGSVTFCGDGSLEIASAETAILVRAGGASDFVRIEPQVRLTAQSGSGSVIRVEDTSLSSGAIVFDTSEPELWAVDASQELVERRTTDGAEIDVCTLPGEDGLFGLEYVIDTQTESFVYNIYSLGAQDAAGLYDATLLQEGVEDVSAYQKARTPHVWTLADAYGAAVSRARFARFTISASCTDGGAIGVSQSAIGRGGSVTVSVAPEDGYKLVSLCVNGEPVSPANGSYTIAGITSDKTVTASFAQTAAVEIDAAAPSVTDFTVPADGEQAFVSEPFTAVVRDGAGDAVGATVNWSIAPQTAGVSIGADGRVTVENAAKNAAGNGLSFTVTAAAAGTELSEECGSFTVSLAERHAASIRLTRGGEFLGESDAMQIPAAGERATQQYGAVVYDQYGAVREEAVNWVAGDWPTGVRRDGDTLSVTGECSDGSMLIVTASASSDSTVTASVTVSFVKPEETARRSSPVRGGAEPEISWPTVTLATESDRIYGITWAQLVTLSGGSATLGGETLTGSFSINKDASALPNVSDSYKIVFTYTEGTGETAETITVESEAQTVTLTPRTITDAMVTLAPETTPYTGTAIEPAVTLHDGEQELVSGTDFDITCSDNIAAGTATATIVGRGNYSGTVTKSFTITPKAITDAMVMISPAEMQYAYGEACSPGVAVRDGSSVLVSETDFSAAYAGNTQIGSGSVSVTGQGNYSGTVTKTFTITPIPASALSCSVTSCKPEDEGIKPAIVFMHDKLTLTEGTDYDLSLQYDIPSKTGTATAAFKGVYSGTRVLSFDLPNYLITDGASGSWSKSTAVTLNFKANGALGKFAELTVDGKTVPSSYYSTESGSTIVKIKPDYLKGLTAGKHIVGIAYKDGKALAIFSITDVDRRGVPTGDSSNVVLWLAVLAASLIAVCALGYAFLRSGGKKKKKKKNK